MVLLMPALRTPLLLALLLKARRCTRTTPDGFHLPLTEAKTSIIILLAAMMMILVMRKRRRECHHHPHR